MANVGLLFVGAVLFLNGIMLLGKVDARSAAVFNLFIGALQVLTPTYLIFTSGGRFESAFDGKNAGWDKSSDVDVQVFGHRAAN